MLNIVLMTWLFNFVNKLFTVVMVVQRCKNIVIFKHNIVKSKSHSDTIVLNQVTGLSLNTDSTGKSISLLVQILDYFT